MFRWLRRKPSKTPSEPAIPTDIEQDHIVEVVPEHQHDSVTSPTLQSVYLSPSERDLYLASLAGLDRPSPALPLWSEPPPKLPEVDHPTPIHTPALPSVPEARRPRLSGVTPVSFGPRGHALLTFSGDGELRFVGFNRETILASEKQLSTWHSGVEGRSRLPEDGGVWRIVLKGRVWRVKGNKEKETVEMLIALFTVLGQQGWTPIGPMTAGLGKHEFQNIVFTNSGNHAPVYVALSLPLPDRVSIVYPQGGVPSKLIEPVRNAILDASPPVEKSSSFSVFKEAAKRTSSSTRHSSASRTSTDTTDTSKSGRSSSTDDSSLKDRDPSAIKLEGWVHENVYRFWLAGMGRWSISKSVVIKHQPPLMLAILTALSGEHFALAASIPLSPRLPGRDLLLFATTPESNILSLDPLLSTPRARPTPVPDLPDEPRVLYSYAGPSSHGSAPGSPPSGILSALAFDSPASPVSRYATPEGRMPNGHSLGAALDPAQPPSIAQEAYTGRPSIDTIKSWASTVNTAHVRGSNPGSPGRPGSPGLREVTPRSSLDPHAWGAQRKKGRDGSHSPEPPSSFEARRRPAAISPLVYNSVGLGSAPDFGSGLRDADLLRQASDASRTSCTSRSTADSSRSRSTTDSTQHPRTQSRKSSRHTNGTNGHHEEHDRERERKSKTREREPNRAPGSRRTRTSIAISDNGQA